jgi:hypothetical protein
MGLLTHVHGLQESDQLGHILDPRISCTTTDDFDIETLEEDDKGLPKLAGLAGQGIQETGELAEVDLVDGLEHFRFVTNLRQLPEAFRGRQLRWELMLGV